MKTLLALLFLAACATAADRPNFVVFLIDDLGATDLGCYGSTFYETPNLDRLAQDGMKFRTAYSACTVCSPTRAAMLTGKYPARLHLTDWIPGHGRRKARLAIPDWKKELPASEPTIASILRDQGYATCAIGKWHLSPAGPAAHGFDVAIANNHRGLPTSYLSPYKNPNLTDGPDGEELTDRCTAEAVKFIREKRDRPFFVYLPHFAVHTPLGAKPDAIQKYRDKAKTTQPQGQPAYAAMIQAVDESVGTIRAELKTLGLSEKTVIIFTSDNGGLKPTTNNLGLRAGKGSAYEGGIRVPLIIHWPGTTKPGSESTEPVITMDIPHTVADAAGASLKGDGQTLRPALTGGKLPARPLFWHYPHYHPGGATPYSAMRDGSLRLLRFYEDGKEELYDLATDPLEATDLAKTQPDKAAALRAKLDAWLKATNAQLPTPNPDYAP